MIETIAWNETPLAYIVHHDGRPEQTAFYTPPEATLQVGHIVYLAGGEITRHVHLPVERRIDTTGEVLVVQDGACEVDIFTDDRQLVATRVLRAGDVMVVVGGGHGFRLLEDTVLLEVKQGPYPGTAEKERF